MSKTRNFDKKIIKQRYGINAGRTMAQISEKNNALKCSEDTILRTELQGIIISLVRQKIDKKEIKETLLKNKRYSKYEIYFDTWIEDKIKNEEKIQKQKEK